MLEDRSANTTPSGAPHTVGRASMRVIALTALPLTKPGSVGVESSCATCYLQSACLPSGLTPEALIAVDELARTKRKVRRGVALYRRGERFESLYAIHSGSFKSVGIGRDQQEQKVTALHLPADLLGLEAISSEVHEYDAIALEDSEVCVVPYAQLTRLTLGRAPLQAHLMGALSRDIARDGGLLLRLGGLTAEERLGAFLLGLSERYERLGCDGTRFSVRMKREDIASYLGLTIETISRVLSRLQREGLVKSQHRNVTITDLSRLRQLAG